MAFGKTILYQDFNSNGSGNARYFAEDINDFIMAMQGNYVVSGCDVTVDTETDLTASGNHLDIAAGVAFVNGAKRTISNTHVDLSTAFAALSAGESRLILVYINSSGSVATISGDITTDGNHLPESSSTGWTPVDTTPLAWIYLVAEDSTMSSNAIRNQIHYAPNGGYFIGNVIMSNNGNSYYTQYEGPSANFRVYTDSANDFVIRDVTAGIDVLEIENGGASTSTYVRNKFKNPVDSGGLYTGASDDLRMYHDGSTNYLTGSPSLWLQATGGSSDLVLVAGRTAYHRVTDTFRIDDSGDSNEGLFVLDVSGRTLDIGATDGNDDVETRFFGNIGFNTTDIEAWDSSIRTIEGVSSSLIFHHSGGNGIWLASNMYYDGDWKNKTADDAGYFNIDEDRAIFRYATNATINTSTSEVDGFIFDGDRGNSPTFTVFNATQTGAMTVHGTLSADLEVSTTFTPSAFDDGADNTFNQTVWIGTETIVNHSLNKRGYSVSWSIPTLTGTQSLSADTVTVNFQIDKGSGSFTTVATLTISSSGYGSWSATSGTETCSGTNVIRWRIEQVQNGANSENFNIGSFQPDDFTITVNLEDRYF